MISIYLLRLDIDLTDLYQIGKLLSKPSEWVRRLILRAFT